MRQKMQELAGEAVGVGAVEGEVGYAGAVRGAGGAGAFRGQEVQEQEKERQEMLELSGRQEVQEL